MKNKFSVFLSTTVLLPLFVILTLNNILCASTIPQVDAGPCNTVVLKSDGTVWAWGMGDIGRSLPLQVSGLSGVIAIEAGNQKWFALKPDGTVWAWGRNDKGQLGDGTTKSRGTPMLVNNLGNVIAITSGLAHSIALKSDGTVWTWGSNEFGQLGDGTTIYRSTPVQVRGLSGVIAIAAGLFHSLALKADGIVWAWGKSDMGQLGDGTTIDKSTPVQVRVLDGVIAIAGGGCHNLALKSDGTVWAWGNNYSGQLGNETKQNSSIPVQLNSLGGVVAIASKFAHDLVLKSDGTVWAWGANSYGQLGDGTTINRCTPVQVINLGGDVVAVTCGGNNSFALKSDGTLWEWGNDWEGSGEPKYPNRTLPTQVKINLGDYRMEALKAKEKAESRKRYNEFVKKNSVEEWPDISEFSANPFIHDGKIVALRVSFGEMQTATQGIFAEVDSMGAQPFVVSDIPKGMFKKSGTIVVLAGKVLGKTELQVPLLGLRQVPHLKFVGAHFCQDYDCNDIMPE